MARAEKVTAVAELTERFQSSSGAVLTEYRGLTVAQLSELRKSLGENASFSVVKNTLTKIAASEAGVTSELTDLLTGPSAIAFVHGDVVEAAKGLRDFAKAYPLLVIKGGVLDGKPLTPPEIARLADLESREALLAKLAGAMKASMAGAAATFAALPSQLARLLGALEQKRAAEGPAVAASAADSADVAVADATVADAGVAAPDATVADADVAVPDATVADAVPDATVADAVPDAADVAVPEAQASTETTAADQPASDGDEG
jgi:large subunit ribosomal protein L10